MFECPITSIMFKIRQVKTIKTKDYVQHALEIKRSVRPLNVPWSGILEFRISMAN